MLVSECEFTSVYRTSINWPLTEISNKGDSDEWSSKLYVN